MALTSTHRTKVRFTGKPPKGSDTRITDQMNRAVEIPESPRRIVSLVPSQTELLFYLGLDEEVVGITKFCIHPAEQFRKKPKVGGTKQVHLDRVDALRPDLIIGNKEENDQAQIEALAEKYPVWMSDIKTVDDALDMIRSIGSLLGREARSEQLIEQLHQSFSALKTRNFPKKRAAYFIWKGPYMVAAKGTFIDEMLQLAGFENVFAHLERYPPVTMSELAAAAPEVILLSSEPYPFKEKHELDFQKSCPNAKVLRVDGELFSWYGSRLLESAGYFGELRGTLSWDK